MPVPILQIKRGGYNSLPALRAGEPGFSTDKYDLFIGLNSTSNGNKFFGSHRYWTRENGSVSLSLNLVDKDGSNYISLKSPNTLAGVVTYSLPGTQGTNKSVLTNDGFGNLYWDNGFTNSVLSGITTVTGSLGITSTTESTSKNTGAVVIDGGLGVKKSINIGLGISISENLYTNGLSTFVGNVRLNSQLRVAGVSTFVLDSEFNKNLRVSGITTLTTMRVTGISTLMGDVQLNNNLNVVGISTLVSNVFLKNNLTVNGASDLLNAVSIGDQLSVAGVSTFQSDAEFNQNLKVVGVTTILDFTFRSGIITGPSAIIIDPAGVGTNTGSVRIKGDLYVDGETTSINSSTLKVKDNLIEAGLIDNGSGILIPPSSDSNVDLGFVMHYYDTSAKKAALYWDDSVQRIGIASNVTESVNILSTVSWAEVEMGALWFNDCAGQSKTVTCISGERRLENITIDGGSY